MKPVFFQTLFFLTRVRLRAIFLSDHAVWWNLARLLLLLFVMAAGWFYGFLYDAVLNNPANEWRASRLDAGLHALAITLVVLMNYVPSFRPRSQYLHTLFPVSHRFRLGINLYGDQLSVIYGYAIVFMVMMVAGGNQYTIWSGINAFLFLLSIIIIERNVKVIIEQVMPGLFSYLVAVAALGVSVLLYLGLGIPEFLEPRRHMVQSVWFLLNGAMALLLYMRLSAAAGPKRPRREASLRPRKQFDSIVPFIRQLYLRRKATVVTLFMLVVSKLFVSGYGFVIMGSERELFGDLSGYYLITLLLPIIPFSYVHNNMAGFFRESWVQICLQSGRLRTLLRAYYWSIAPILIFDVALSFIILSFFGLLTASVVLYYVLALSLFLPLGVVSSLHHPRYIERFFSVQNMANFRNNSSGLYLLLFFAIALLLTVAMFSGLLYWMVIPVLLLSGYLISMLPRYYSKRRYLLYGKLYEE